MQEVRVGIIGTGIIAHKHAKMYSDIPGAKIVAACDLDEEKLEKFCKQYDIPNQYSDFRELLRRDDIDAVDVCLHNNLHAPVSIAVMEAGKHCYCEKPIAGSYADALAMKKAAEQTGKRLHIQLSTLYNSECRAAKRVVDSGFLGELYHARSYGYRRRGRPFVDGYGEKEFVMKEWAEHGALFDLGVYHISLMLFLLGVPEVDKVTGKVYQKLDMNEKRKIESDFNVEEMGVGFVKFKNKLTLDIAQAWAVQNGDFPYSSISGSQGGLRFTSGVLDRPYTGNETLELFSEIAGYPATTTLALDREEYRMHQIYPESKIFENSITHWVGILRGQCEPIDTLNIALHTEQISEGIFLSSVMNREIDGDEIAALSKSSAFKRQETSFGGLQYDIHAYLS